MKLTKSKLKQIIKEEVRNVLKETVPNPEFRAKVEKGEREKALSDAASGKAIESTVEPGQFIGGRGRYEFQPVGPTPKEDLVWALYSERHDDLGAPLAAVAEWWLTNFPNQNSPIGVYYIAHAFKAQGDLDAIFDEPLNAAGQRIKDKMESWR